MTHTRRCGCVVIYACLSRWFPVRLMYARFNRLNAGNCRIPKALKCRRHKYHLNAFGDPAIASVELRPHIPTGNRLQRKGKQTTTPAAAGVVKRSWPCPRHQTRPRQRTRPDRSGPKRQHANRKQPENNPNEAAPNEMAPNKTPPSETQQDAEVAAPRRSGHTNHTPAAAGVWFYIRLATNEDL
ncbi:hypothetical protein BS47DRAFT_1369261 [Hydnum rufescens UP504]|uniref:Uncharacterized protein n=1 Tax=Hydnum rufescens UP504 TaxID=1448309 RepID=A0A9P6AEE3_9AGAM|nr:hypothetical protein BS47DRAFT_1369261 [Hydnum rufescens UP504]